MGSALLHLLGQALALTLQYMGTSVLALVAGVVLFLVREIITWHRDGLDTVKNVGKARLVTA